MGPRKRKGTVILGVGLLFVMAAFAGVADAGLVQRETFVGNYGVSTDGLGMTASSGTISAEIPLGAEVVKAYLYSANYSFSSPLANVTFGGTTLSFAAADTWVNSFARTGIKDVTSIVKATTDGGSGVFNFTVVESNSTATDGEALVVVYKLADTTKVNTVAILDGPQALTGDTFTATFASPLDKTKLDFFAEMRLGISFGNQQDATQASTVKVNSTTITDWAGDFDDGQHANGALMTVGGYDDPYSAFLPDRRQDHERYNLYDQIINGSSSINVFTINPSNDDNIFLAVFSTLGAAKIDDGTQVPEPGTLLLLGSGLVGLVGYRRTKRMM